MMFIAAQVIGVIALICQVLMFWQKKRIMLLTFSFLECVLFGIHYYMLGSLAGALLDILSGFISLFYVLKGKYKITRGYYLPIFFTVVVAVISYFTYESYIEIFCIIAVGSACWIEWLKNTKYIRIFSIIFVLIPYLTYGILLPSIQSAIGDGLVIITTLFAIYTLDIRKKAYK